MNNEQSQSASAPKPHRALGRIITLLVVLGVSLGVFFYGSNLLDQVKASKFTPTAQVAAAEARIGFTPRGKQIFYATSPAVEDKTAFNQSCSSGERTAAILGCYFKDRIFLYNVTDKELDGTLEVTAAHETLHAAYHRLNYFERQQVDDLVRAEYEKIKDQPDIKQVMQYYQKAEPGAELDELHSIIGTTIADLSPQLETYYSCYFTDRASVVALNAKYNAVFSQLTAEADALQQKIDAEGPAIKSAMAQYEINLTQLNLDIQSFNDRADTGAFRTQNEFATARGALEARVAVLNGERDALNARVDAYNAAVDTLNSLAVHVNKLNESINGVEAPSSV